VVLVAEENRKWEVAKRVMVCQISVLGNSTSHYRIELDWPFSRTRESKITPRCGISPYWDVSLVLCINEGEQSQGSSFHSNTHISLPTSPIFPPTQCLLIQNSTRTSLRIYSFSLPRAVWTPWTFKNRGPRSGEILGSPARLIPGPFPSPKKTSLRSQLFGFSKPSLATEPI
jgi:hypothetical protein